VKGYSVAEVMAPVKPMATGISKWDLDTPALCVDLDKLEQNIAKMQRQLAANKLGSRPHAKTHKCAPIAKLQMAAGALGICTAKLSEAEALAGQGLDRICMTTGNLSSGKIRRAMQLRKRTPQFIQAVDYEPNAHDLNAAAKEAGIVADVVIDVAVGTRSGIPAGDEALALAKLVDRLPNLKLRGLLSYDGGAQHITGFTAERARAEEHRSKRPHLRGHEGRRPQHRDLQRRWHGHLQHPAPRARVHRRAGGQLSLHGHAVPGDWRRRRQPRLLGLRALVDGAGHGRKQPFPRPVDH
jgi:D-serine deaminase-like pyridoxal phosphate-dependent protein